MKPDGTTDSKLLYADVTRVIIGAFYVVYNELGFGFLESIYARALEIVLREQGLGVEREVPLIIRFRGEQIGFHRCDMVVNRTIIVEIKACERLSPSHFEQLRNYLSATELQLGMLLHFGPQAKFYRSLNPRCPVRSD